MNLVPPPFYYFPYNFDSCPTQNKEKHHFVFKRRLYIPDGPLEHEELACKDVNDAAHRLAYIDAAYNVVNGFFPISREQAAWLAALQVQSAFGDHDAKEHDFEFIEPHLRSIMPPNVLDKEDKSWFVLNCFFFTGYKSSCLLPETASL